MKKRGVLFVAGLILAIILLVPAGKKDDGGNTVVTGYVSAVAATASPTVTATPKPTATPRPTATPTPRPTATPVPSATPTPLPKPSYMIADYKGESIVIGKEYDTKNLEVTMYYDDGSYEIVDTYDISGRKVTELGTNKFIVLYRGLIADFYVTGKKAVDVSASCSRFSYSVGNAPDERDLTVSIFYSDGTSEIVDDYIVSPNTVSKVGSQELTIVSRGLSTKINVWGEQVKKIKSVSVSWDSSYKPITGEVISKKDLSVMAVYEDYTYERVSTYQLLTSQFANPGENEIKIAYRGLSATTKVQVEARVATEIRAEYKGPAVYVGEEPDRSKIEVYVKFNNGRETKVEDYSMKPELIEIPGENKIRITYDKLGTDIYVKGEAEPEPDFEHASNVDLESDFGDFNVAVAVPKRLGTDDILDVQTLKKNKVKKLMKKLKITGDYVAFDVQFVDDDNEAELPLPLRITIPDEFDIDYTYLYYSSNVRTQAAMLKINKNDEKNYIEPNLFSKVGTYILVCDPTVEMTEDEREEYLEKKNR